MIRGFQDEETKRVFRGERSAKLPPDIQNTARRKLQQVDAAVTLLDLRAPPGNRLEKLTGDRDEQHSIRINEQWRICFRWNEGGAEQVEIVDYH